MIDRIFSLSLTFAVLLGSTLAIGGEFYSPRSVSHQAKAITELPRVVITGRATPDTNLAHDTTRQATRAQ